MKFLLLVFVVLMSGCSAGSLGKVTRYQSDGQSIICWEPSQKMSGLATFAADKIEGGK